MLKSMTGYGNSVLEGKELTVRAELKSLNSRNLDFNIRVPRVHSEKEISIRSRLSILLQRGKISLVIETEYHDTKAGRRMLNKDLLLAYYKDLKEIAELTGSPTDNLLPALLNVSELLQPSIEEDTAEEEWNKIEEALNEAIKKFEDFRAKEGATLGKELTSYINSIERLMKQVEAQKDERLARVKADLKEKLSTIIQDAKLDENRLEQELIYYAEKLDITEEIVRLRSHLHYFLQSMNEEGAGKKLGFIAQEIGREINTIGSKANDAAIQKDVVLMKDELEKIKEQVLNIL